MIEMLKTYDGSGVLESGFSDVIHGNIAVLTNVKSWVEQVYIVRISRI
jgi:hypothetical protein